VPDPAKDPEHAFPPKPEGAIMRTYTHDEIRLQLLMDRDCSRVSYKIWTQRAASAATNSKLAGDRGDATKARDLRKEANVFRGHAETCLVDANTAQAAMTALDKNSALLAVANNVPDQLDKALAIARAINAASARL
jgi:hypothetical protein